jgi:hypothetical protein
MLKDPAYYAKVQKLKLVVVAVLGFAAWWAHDFYPFWRYLGFN